MEFHSRNFNMTTSIDLQKSLSKLFICIQLEEKANRDTILGMAIYNACISKQPCNDIIDWVKSQAEDNPRLMSEIITEELTHKILTL